MTDIAKALKSEITELEAELLADPRQRKLQRLRAALAEYEPLPGHVNGNAAHPSEPIEAGLSAATKATRMRSKINAIIDETGSAHRKKLLEGLISAGIMGTEKDPMQALAIFLSSHKELYEFDGSGNYSRRKTPHVQRR